MSQDLELMVDSIYDNKVPEKWSAKVGAWMDGRWMDDGWMMDGRWMDDGWMMDG